jgi:hypothetical protein
MGKSIIEVASIAKLGMPLLDTTGAIINIANFQPQYPLYVLNTKEQILIKHNIKPFHFFPFGHPFRQRLIQKA